MADQVSHLTFYLQHGIFWQPRYIKGISIVTYSATCFSENWSLVSDMHQEPKHHKAFLIEAAVPMSSALDAPTGLSCLLLHLNCPEKRQIKNIFLCLARSETIDSRCHGLPPCSHTWFVHYTPFKAVVPSILPHDTCASDPSTVTAMQPSSAPCSCYSWTVQQTQQKTFSVISLFIPRSCIYCVLSTFCSFHSEANTENCKDVCSRPQGC